MGILDTIAELTSMVQSQAPLRSRPLDLHRWARYPELERCLSNLVDEIEAREGRARARSKHVAQAMRDSVRCLVLDLYVTSCADPDSVLGVVLSKRRLNESSRYKPDFATYDAFMAAFGGLRDCGYINVIQKGFIDRGTGESRATRVRATARLLSLLAAEAHLSPTRVAYRTGEGAPESVVLKDGGKHRIEYAETNRTVSMRFDVARINAHLQQHLIDIYLTDAEFTDLRRRRQVHDNDPNAEGRVSRAGVDLTAKRLVRIFNNGDWSQGGRFYGGWWQGIPRTERPYITIDGKHTVELDYSGMHPALLYAQAGVGLDGDPYDVGLPPSSRDIIKVAFNALLNAKARPRAPSEFDEQEVGLSWSALLRRVEERHAQIKHMFQTGYGLRLQNTDAEIANRVMLEMLDRGYVCLPVHDSFIVHHGLEDELERMMRRIFEDQVGAEIAVKAKLNLVKAQMAFGPTGMVDASAALSDHLDGTSEYSGYVAREQEWLAGRWHTVRS